MWPGAVQHVTSQVSLKVIFGSPLSNIGALTCACAAARHARKQLLPDVQEKVLTLLGTRTSKRLDIPKHEPALASRGSCTRSGYPVETRDCALPARADARPQQQQQQQQRAQGPQIQGVDPMYHAFRLKLHDRMTDNLISFFATAGRCSRASICVICNTSSCE
jgi:hypothetical protein